MKLIAVALTAVLAFTAVAQADGAKRNAGYSMSKSILSGKSVFGR